MCLDAAARTRGDRDCSDSDALALKGRSCAESIFKERYISLFSNIIC
jgi:hypothetical protein